MSMHCRTLQKDLNFDVYAFFLFILLGSHSVNASLAKQDKPSYIYFPAASAPPSCPGSECSHHYSSTALTSHIRDMEEDQKNQIVSARRTLEQSTNTMITRSQEQLNDNMNRITEQNRIRDQEIARLTNRANVLYPVWSTSTNVEGVYTVNGWDSRGPVVMTERGNRRVPVVTASIKGGGKELPLHYEAFFGKLRFVRFALTQGEEGDVFAVYPEQSDQPVKNMMVVTQRVPKQSNQYKIDFPAELKKALLQVG